MSKVAEGYSIRSLSKDYMGSTKDEQIKCIEQIIKICRDHKYTHLFAGYGFMAEDADFVSRIENAEIIFVGPSSKVIESALINEV